MATTLRDSRKAALRAERTPKEKERARKEKGAKESTKERRVKALAESTMDPKSMQSGTSLKPGRLREKPSGKIGVMETRPG